MASILSLLPFDAVTLCCPRDKPPVYCAAHRITATCILQVLAMEEAAGERPATATVRLQRSDTTVTVRCSDLVEINEARAARDAARVGARDDGRAERNGACWFKVGPNQRLSQCVFMARWRRFVFVGGRGLASSYLTVCIS